MSNRINMQSGAITILGFEIFEQKVSYIVRIAIPRHELRFDNLNLIFEKCLLTENFKSTGVRGFDPCCFTVKRLETQHSHRSVLAFS